MPISQTAEYALRAVTCLSRHDVPQTTQHIAECTGVPQSYLPKVLQPLTRAEIVKAQRGVRGGYSLQRDSEELTVLDVVNCVDPLQRIANCPGDHAGLDSTHCPMHKLLDNVLQYTEERFSGTTISQLAYLPDGAIARCGNLDTTPPASVEPCVQEVPQELAP